MVVEFVYGYVVCLGCLFGIGVVVEFGVEEVCVDVVG